MTYFLPSVPLNNTYEAYELLEFYNGTDYRDLDIELATQNTFSNYTNEINLVMNNTIGTPAQMLEGPLYTTGPLPTGPEPATFVLVGAALIGIGWSWRRRIRKPGSCHARLPLHAPVSPATRGALARTQAPFQYPRTELTNGVVRC